MDFLFLEGIRLQVLIGVLPRERIMSQIVEMDAEIHLCLKRAGENDSLEDTLDYARAVSLLQETAAKTKFKLLEALAEELASVLLKLPGVTMVKLRLSKPGILPSLKRVGICIIRP